jgi:ABC-type sugar transport system substrate-binding protein
LSARFAFIRPQMMMALLKRRALTAAFLPLLLFMAACRQSEPPASEPGAAPSAPRAAAPQASSDLPASSPVRLLLLLDSRYEPMRLVQMKMLTRLAQSRPGLQFECMDASGSAAAQRKQIVDNDSKVDFLLVFPVDLTEISEVLRIVKRHGAKVMLFNAEAPADVADTAIFCDEQKVGRIAGEFVVNSLRQHAKDQGYESVLGRVVYLQDEGGGAALKPRHEVFVTALAAEPGITLVHEAPVDASGTQAAARLAEAYRLQRNFDVIFADTDLIAQAASAAITATHPTARENMLIVGVDGAMGQGGGVDLIINSKIDATILRPPLVNFAWAIVKKCLDDPQFQPKPRYDQDPQLVTLETAMQIAREGLPAPQVE